mmetsp:Transcript_28341/g.42853  ORF Transcript_28341/g.42853 Transcript_28341/m.42853 type:complete len:311 (-) Transcript_28341:747-1679(-)
MPFFRRSCTREECKMDVEVMLDRVLPLCQSRPTVYNELGKCTQQWISEIVEMDEVMKLKSINDKKAKIDNIACKEFVGDEEVSVSDSATFMNEEDVLSNPDIEWSIPNNSDSPTSIQQLQQDYELLKSFNIKSLSKRSRVRRTIRSMIEKLEKDISLYKDIRHKKALRSIKERDAEQDLLIFALDQIEDHPYVYNQILVRLHSLGSRRGSHERWKKPPKATSTSRWSDVQCLDELMDMVPTDSQVRDFLHVLRENCRTEAKDLTRLELQSMPDSPPNIRKMLLRPEEKSDIQKKSHLSNYHITHSIALQG